MPHSRKMVSHNGEASCVVVFGYPSIISCVGWDCDRTIVCPGWRCPGIRDSPPSKPASPILWLRIDAQKNVHADAGRVKSSSSHAWLSDRQIGGRRGRTRGGVRKIKRGLGTPAQQQLSGRAAEVKERLWGIRQCGRALGLQEASKRVVHRLHVPVRPHI